MINHPKLIEFEKKLKDLVHELDERLEERYGGNLTLHPARRPRGTTSNSAHDGLFDIRGEFTLGLGSESGKGYIIDIDIKTLDKIPEDYLKSIKKDTKVFLEKNLPAIFPGRDLSIIDENGQIKITGDLSLGKA